MWRTIYELARRVKETLDWVGLLGWLGIPGAMTGIALVKQWEWDVTVPYVLCGIAFWIVVEVSGIRPILRGRRSTRSQLVSELSASTQRLYKRVNEWETASLKADRDAADEARAEAQRLSMHIAARLQLQVSSRASGYFMRPKPNEPYSRKRLESLPDGNHINEMWYRVVRLEEIVKEIEEGRGDSAR